MDTGEKHERSKPRRRLPETWAPKKRHVDLVATLGLPAEHLGKAADRFRGHWTAKGTALADWDATFDNWLKKDAADGPRSAAYPKRVDNRQNSGWAASQVADDGETTDDFISRLAGVAPAPFAASA